MVSRLLLGLDVRIGGIFTIKIVGLRRGRIHFSYERGPEFEIFERLDQKTQEGPYQRGEATD